MNASVLKGPSRLKCFVTLRVAAFGLRGTGASAPAKYRAGDVPERDLSKRECECSNPAPYPTDSF